MDIMAIFGTQFLLSILVFTLIARWYVVPALAGKPNREALTLLILPHTLRHLGLIFIVPGLVGENLSPSFAGMAAYGDLASGLLAIVSIIALRRNWRVAIPLAWVFNVVGVVDLVNALRQADTVPDLGVAWLVPTFVVPVLLVTHVMIFARLVRQRRLIALQASS